MKILAMDLSLSSPAFAVMEVVDNKIKLHQVSHVKTNSKKPHGYRLFEIFYHMEDIYKQHPDIQEVVREKGFSRYPRTTQILFQVVGISTICAYKYGFEGVDEHAPTTVKKTVTGNGKASKDEVADALKNKFNINTNFKTDDESDAVAVGITHFKKKKVLV